MGSKAAVVSEPAVHRVTGCFGGRRDHLAAFRQNAWPRHQEFVCGSVPAIRWAPTIRTVSLTSQPGPVIKNMPVVAGQNDNSPGVTGARLGAF